MQGWSSKLPFYAVTDQIHDITTRLDWHFRAVGIRGMPIEPLTPTQRVGMVG